MVVISKPAIRVEQNTQKEHPLIQIGLLAAAGLFVSVLLMTYGMDLSLGFF